MIFLMLAAAGADHARHLGVLSGLGKPNKKAPVVGAVASLQAEGPSRGVGRGLL